MKILCLASLLFFSLSVVNAQNLLKVGTVAPSVAFKTAYQKNYKIPKNKILILDFWATWCGPCVAGLIESNSFVEKYEDKFEYIGITDVTSVNSAQFIKNQKFKHKFIYDDGKIYEDFGVTGIPHAYIIDKNG
ncbi:MAG: TlpA family protein disulfide reductase, partial [Chitinophagaceae bacterium]